MLRSTDTLDGGNLGILFYLADFLGTGTDYLSVQNDGKRG